MHVVRATCVLASVALAAAAPWLEKRQIRTVPQYVIDYAPLVWLYSADSYRPSEIGAQLVHTHPTLNGTTDIPNAPSPLTLNNLNVLNRRGGRNIYLTANGDFTRLPKWLSGAPVNDSASRTCAVVVNDKGKGKVDAFYFYFYAYNRGNVVFGEEFGDHIGDWEHNMIRFQNGAPTAVWYSQHSFGEAFTYKTVERSGKRVVGYSGNGTHATWATAGVHDHVVPGVPETLGPLKDYTDRGVLWDPLSGAYFYTVTYPSSSSPSDDSAPTFSPLPNPFNGETPPFKYLLYKGQWGDNQLPDDDPRQLSLFGGAVARYTAGPNGPRFKGLRRRDVCPAADEGEQQVPCVVQTSLPPGA